jgi:alkylation response protein AidB-like acyl-CoA dehydrogenase
MDIGFTEEQELLRDTARRFLESECSTQFVRQRMAEPAAVTDEFWQKLAEHGWLGIVYPEGEGGSGLGLVDLVVLMEEMGRTVMPGPFVSAVLLGGGAIAEAGTPAQRRQWLPEIAAGNAKATLAWTEPNLRWDAAGIMLRVREAGGGFTLTGTKLFVGDAHLADILVVRRTYPRRQHVGGRRQPVPGAEGHSRADGHPVADDRRDPQTVRGQARQCRIAGRRIARQPA